MFLVSRWPVIEAVQGLYSSSMTIPPQWSVVPASSMWIAEGFDVAAPGAAGAEAYMVEIAPGIVSWINGRAGLRFQLSYINGWPHAQLAAAASAGDTSIQVTDVTGFYSLSGVGVTATIFDEPNDEQVTVAGSEAVNPTILPFSKTAVQTGPGTLTLSSPLQYSHDAGLLVTTIPASVQWATILLAGAQALSRGATAVTVQALRGSLSGSNDMKAGVRAYIEQAKDILVNYRRIL